jgi:hypothetical protein
VSATRTFLAEPVPPEARARPASLASVAGVTAVVVAFYGVYVALRLRQYGVVWFVHLGSQFLRVVTDPAVSHLPAQSPIGYDGQYYFVIAADPLHAHSYLTGGNAGYLYSRILYPMLGRVFSAGSVSALPYAFLVINLVAVAGGTLAVALWLRKRGSSPWFALLYALWPGLLFCTFRDLTEPLAFGLTAAAMLALDPARTRRIALATALFALALLTRETVIPFVVAAGATLALADRRREPGLGRVRRIVLTWKRGAVMVAAACLPLLLWRIVVSARLHEATQEHGSGLSWAVPLHGLATYWPFDHQHWLIATTIGIPALLLGAAACLWGLPRRYPVEIGLLLANVLLFVVFLPADVVVDYGAAARASVGMLLAACYAVPAFASVRVRRPLLAASFFLSLGWFLVMAAVLGLPGIDLVTL